ncbi:MAG TPA: glycosyltransferase family 2 protein [Rhizomicrobium sp.]|nr:glycosyltransferase family 2 protein [Rhizomicrobium sp.]
MHVAVLIVAFRNTSDVVRCMKSLGRSTYPDFEVVICENGGEEAYRKLVAALDEARAGPRTKVVLAPSNGGFAAGVNICLDTARDADAYWILNPDTEPHPDAMGALVRRLAHGDCDASGGVLCFADGRVQSFGGLWIPWRGRFESIGFGTVPNRPVRVAQIERRQNYLSGASMMVSREFAARAGAMREDYFLYGEEVAWCIDAARRGLRLGFCPGARVVHYQGTTTGSTEKISDRSRISVFLGERNRILLTRDYFPHLLVPAIAISLLDLCMRFGRHAAWRQLGYALSGWWAGIRNERGAG